jgi:hypothetical protein
VSTSTLKLLLERLGFTRPGEFFWLSTTPEISDEELAATSGH